MNKEPIKNQQRREISVAAITGGVKTPSTRFRIRQYIPLLGNRNIHVQEHIPYWGESCGLPSPFKTVARIPALFKSRRADIVWLSRDLVMGYETFERLLRHPRIMDVDDAIWLSKPLGRLCQPHIARGMDAVIAGNDYIAEYYGRYCKNVFIVPTSIDINRYTPKTQQQSEKQENFVIGWTGLASNYKYLEMVEDVLAKFLTAYSDTELLIISNRPWQTKKIPCQKIRFISWNEDTETKSLGQMSVGLMPLPDNPWTRGKCSFKMLQYMATALPVVVSPTGMNNLVLSMGQSGFAAAADDQWYQSLETIYKDRTKAIQMGLCARQIVEKFFNTETAADKLAEIFTKFAR